MSSYQLQSPCRVEDGQYIAQNKVAAFWEEEWWRLSWTGRTRESMVQSVADRSPKNLLTNREVRRHQKIVHVETGDIVGYARWILPESHKDCWLEAQTPDVSDEQKEAFAKRHAETNWSPREDNDKLDDHIDGWREKHKQENSMELHYLCVRPDHQRKGLASMLLSSGLEEAKKLGLDVIIVAMGRRALGLYLKHGFELLEEKSQSMSYFGIDKLYETFYLRLKVAS
ncbi:acetyltransferase (GNAT) family domain protein [Fusarium beomiforme]|uniref:Acetyltransferase (GNAT) family domain protein n=1 Tax=Fusarium beomiforme TaxID=44412 RepID=A0A9P5AF58_9HYPO|nr:acetyltransferase (GNAT) family domain protein [Fusarium beomiforme]